MTAPAKLPATYADLEALPANLTGEIIFDALHAHPRPVTRHVTGAHRLSVTVASPFEFGRGGPGGWIFLPEEELHLGPHVVVPDISGWRAERLPADYGESAFITVPPDWICEVMSPRTESVDRVEKRRIYATYGVGHLWYIDPRSRTLEVFERQDREWLLKQAYAEHEDVCAPPFLELTFPLKQLWPFPRSADATI
jgi:hypothetical protein